MTSYLVLARYKEIEPAWAERGIVEANNATDAVRKSYLSEDADPSIIAMVAVPARSWRPTPIRIERTERVILGEDTHPKSPTPEDAA